MATNPYLGCPCAYCFLYFSLVLARCSQYSIFRFGVSVYTGFIPHIPHLFLFYTISSFPSVFLTGLCPSWHIFCLDTGFEHLPLVRLPCWRHGWKRLIPLFQKSPRTLQSDQFPILFHVMLHVQSIQTRRERVRTTE
jgi:hypothetical protein